VGLKVKGTLNDPKVNTTVAKDILPLPLEILKRTITAPAHMHLPKQQAPDIPNRRQKPNPQPKRQSGKDLSDSQHKSAAIRSEVPSKDPSAQLF